jgi:7-cyano-7-deazaguanine synthase
MNNKKAVCILSGGMDSTLTSYIAKNNGYSIIALHFSYGQRTQEKELQCFRNICKKLDVIEKYEIDLPFISQIGANALTDETLDIPTDGLSDDIPITYIPFRNGIFLSIATAIAERESATSLYIGVVQEDSSGYPDCTKNFINSMIKSINNGTKKQTKIQIVAPLIHISKKDIVNQSYLLQVPLQLTWSCYKNSIKACGVCDSCRLRLHGFKMANKQDPISYN